MKRLEPAVASEVVFVPTIGFRPAGTRTLRERAETTTHGTQLAALAVAASPERTDVNVEWKRTGDPATCPPDSRILSHTGTLDGVAAMFVVGSTALAATSLARRSNSVSHSEIRSAHTMTFPPLPADAHDAELLVSEGAHEWRVAFELIAAPLGAKPLAVEAQRDGTVVRATAVTRHGDEVIVGLEVEAARQIRQVGAPLPLGGTTLSGDSAERRARRKEFRRHLSELGEPDRPITLDDSLGGHLEETRRVFSPEAQQAAPGRSFMSRFAVVFEAPAAGAKSATLVVPFVDLNDIDRSVTVSADLRNAPFDVTLGQHHFRVTGSEPRGEERRVFLAVPPSASFPRFVHPARMQGAQAEHFAFRPDPTRTETLSMTTAVSDPPIVTFTGAVLRVDGPFRLEIELP